MTKEKKLRILVAPLDWGLGHATRCIPIIRYLRKRGCDVVVGAEKEVATLLQTNFPDLEIVSLPGYRIHYSRTKSGFIPKMLAQFPRILAAIQREKRWLKGILEKENFDLIISDNRYGLYNGGDIPSIILTHQLQVITGLGRLADRVVRSLHYLLLGNFSECWVVDKSGSSHLGGRLSHPSSSPENTKYVGLLSQFQECSVDEIKGTILLLLSGPEPMRRLLEEKLLKQAAATGGYRFLVVGGTPLQKVPPKIPKHITYFSYLDAGPLARLICEAELVVCRSGYSTLMDLSILKKKALLIPTPGQTEQEYLAKMLHEKGACLVRSQKHIDLERDIPEALKRLGFTNSERFEANSEIQKNLNRILNINDKT